MHNDDRIGSGDESVGVLNVWREWNCFMHWYIH